MSLTRALSTAAQQNNCVALKQDAAAKIGSKLRASKLNRHTQTEPISDEKVDRIDAAWLERQSEQVADKECRLIVLFVLPSLA